MCCGTFEPPRIRFFDFLTPQAARTLCFAALLSLRKPGDRSGTQVGSSLQTVNLCIHGLVLLNQSIEPLSVAVLIRFFGDVDPQAARTLCFAALLSIREPGGPNGNQVGASLNAVNLCIDGLVLLNQLNFCSSPH